MNKKDILDYVMSTPGNTNRAILEQMLNSIQNEGVGYMLQVVSFTATEARELTEEESKRFDEVVSFKMPIIMDFGYETFIMNYQEIGMAFEFWGKSSMYGDVTFSKDFEDGKWRFNI